MLGAPSDLNQLRIVASYRFGVDESDRVDAVVNSLDSLENALTRRLLRACVACEDPVDPEEP